MAAVKSWVGEYCKANSWPEWSGLIALAFALAVSVAAWAIIKFTARNWWYKYWKRIFSPLERGTKAFQRRMERMINDSQNINLLLLSGYTMFYDENELVILETLQSMTQEQRKAKGIKVLMLHPQTDNFKERGEVFVERMNARRHPARPTDFDEYKKRCLKIVSDLRALDAEVRFYSFEPQWRLQIFDGGVFFSFYSSQQDGHLTSLYFFPKADENSAYFGFKKYFDWYWTHSLRDLDSWPRKINCPECKVDIPYTSHGDQECH